MLGPALSEDPAYSSGNPRRCDVLEEWEACGDVLDGEALTVILKSPWPWAEVVLRPEELEWGRARGIPPTSSEEVSGAQHRHGHVPAVRTWLIHERCLSVPKAQARGAAWSLKECSTGQQPPLTRRNTYAVSLALQTLWRFARLGSEAKSCCAFACALPLYPHRGAGCAWRNTHANGLFC